MNKYKLSIIVTSRNDNHGGNLNLRNQIFIDHLCYQANKFQVPIELIIVEWNPPGNKLPLKDAFTYNFLSNYIDINYITVPSNLHYKLFSGKDSLLLYQMIAKNVGARYACSDFLLFTNIDILFPDEFFIFIKNNQLEANTLYRCDRFDISDNIYNYNDPSTYLNFCKHNTLYANKIDGLYDYRTMKKLSNIILESYYENYQIEKPLHTNACGDFQLIAKENFFDLAGYYEYDGYSIHIDSIFEFQCYIAGIKEIILPFPVYHIIHGSGWDVSDENNNKTFIKFLSKKLRILSYWDLRLISYSMTSLPGYFRFNYDNWGLVEYPLNIFNINTQSFIKKDVTKYYSKYQNIFDYINKLISDKFSNYSNTLAENSSNNEEKFQKIIILGTFDNQIIIDSILKYKKSHIFIVDKFSSTFLKLFNKIPKFENISLINEDLSNLLNNYLFLLDNSKIILNYSDKFSAFNSLFICYSLNCLNSVELELTNIYEFDMNDKNDISDLHFRFIRKLNFNYKYLDYYVTQRDNKIYFSFVDLAFFLNLFKSFKFNKIQNKLFLDFNNKYETFINTNLSQKYTYNPFVNIIEKLKSQNSSITNEIKAILDLYFYNKNLGFKYYLNFYKFNFVEKLPIENASLIAAIMLTDANNFEDAKKFVNLELNYYPENYEAINLLDFLNNYKNII